MSKDVKGVFVQLPLSGEDCMTIRKHITSKCLTNDGIVNGIRAIGTPVAGGELDVLASRIDSVTNVRCVPVERVALVSASETETLLCDYKKSQAHIAARDAEIAEERRISNLRADAVERWANTCAQQDEVIDGLRAEIARLWSALDGIEMGIDALPDDNEDYSRMTAREMQRQALIIVKEEMKALKGLEA